MDAVIASNSADMSSARQSISGNTGAKRDCSVPGNDINYFTIRYSLFTAL